MVDNGTIKTVLFSVDEAGLVFGPLKVSGWAVIDSDKEF